MSGMQGEFDADLRAAFEVAREYRDEIEHLKAVFRETPEAKARETVETISDTMERCRAEAATKWHVDIADLDGLEKADLDPHDLPEVTSLFDRVHVYHAFGEFLGKIKEHADDPSLSEQELAEKVCDIGIEALEVFESSLLHAPQH